jgi:putative nucleotidyltransferase with HDIG domain
VLEPPALKSRRIAAEAGPVNPAQALSDQLRTLPVRAGAAVRLLQLLDDPRVDGARLAEVIETDPTLAARLLQLANSPFYGIARGVASVTQATVVVGLSVVQAFAAAAAAGVLVKRDGTMPPDYWDHSMAVAAAAAVVARREGLDAAEGLTAGLLHDLGTALLFRLEPRRYAALERAAPAGSAHRLEAETDAFGADHATTGALVLETWRLPRRIVEAVGAHHAGEPSPLAAVLARAEVLAASARPDLHPADPAVGAVGDEDDSLVAAVRDAADQLTVCFSAV